MRTIPIASSRFSPHNCKAEISKLDIKIVGEESIAKPSYIKNVWVEFPNNSW